MKGISIEVTVIGVPVVSHICCLGWVCPNYKLCDNTDNDPRYDDQHSPQTIVPQMPPPHHCSTHSLDQQGSSDDGGLAHMRYISHCFIYSVTFNALGV
jgi:hypothetical protein